MYLIPKGGFGTTNYSIPVDYTATTQCGAITTAIACLDTTTLPNGQYLLELIAQDSSTKWENSVVLLTVSGAYKPGRVKFSVTDLTVPVAGMPITIGRTYDSLQARFTGLDSNNPLDFGAGGWNFSIEPLLNVGQTGDVTITQPNGKRVTFYLAAQSYGWLGNLMKPVYQAEPGAYGSLTADSCNIIYQSTQGFKCFFSNADYGPAHYTYTDPYGRIYVTDGLGQLQTIQDINGTTLTFDQGGIKSSTAPDPSTYYVSFGRDSTSGNIHTITDPAGNVITYDYYNPNDPNGPQSTSTCKLWLNALARVTYPKPDASTSAPVIQYCYNPDAASANSPTAYLLYSLTDASQHTPVILSYDTNGRVATETRKPDTSTQYVTTYDYSISQKVTVNHTTIVGQSSQDNGSTSKVYDTNGNVLKESDALGRYTTYVYDAQNNLREVLLPDPTNGHASCDPTSQTCAISTGTCPDRHLCYTYDPVSGAPLTQTTALGKPSTISYDSNSPFAIPTSITLPVNGNTTYTVSIGTDTNFNPTVACDADSDYSATATFATCPAGGAQVPVGAYSWDNRGNMLSQTDGNGHTTLYTYDQFGNESSRSVPVDTDSNNSTIYATTYSKYDNLGRLIKQIDPLRNTTEYGYDTLNRQTSQTTHPDATTNYITQYKYDANGNKTDELAARQTSGGTPIQTHYEYDTLNRVTKITYDYGTAQATFSTFTYDWRGNVIDQTDRNGNVTHSVYDNAGQLTSVTRVYDVANSADHYDRNDVGTLAYCYDGAGRKKSQTDNLTAPLSAADCSATTPSQGHTTKYSYDSANHLHVVTDPYGHTTTYSYNDAGQPLTVQKQRNATATDTTTYGYDIRGRQTRVTLPQVDDCPGGSCTPVTYKRYDSAGNLVCQSNLPTNAAAMTATSDCSNSSQPFNTYYTYDVGNRLRKVVSPLQTLSDGTHRQRVMTYNYDLNGNSTSTANATSASVNDHVTVYTYDGLGRLVTKTLPDGTYETSGYDAGDNKISQRLTDGNINTYKYDDFNRLQTLTYFDKTFVSYTYYAEGQRKTVVDGRGTTTYTYDGQNRLSSVQQPNNGPSISYRYDAAHNRTAVLVTTGGTTTATAYAYNDRNELCTVTDNVSTSPLPSPPTSCNAASSAWYTYDFAGNRTKLTYPNGMTTDYSPDGLGRTPTVVQKASGGQQIAAYSYQFWPSGQRDNVKENNSTAATLQWLYDDAGRLRSEQRGSATTNYTYDDADNLVSDGTHSLSYDSNDRITSAGFAYDKRGNLRSDGTNSYTYDGADRVTQVNASSGSVSTSSYDADGLRVSQTNGNNTTKYIWASGSCCGTNVLAETDASNVVQSRYVLGNNELLAQMQGSTPYYALRDGQGNVRTLTNGSSSQSYSYDAYGNLVNAPTSLNTHYLYRGQQYDNASGLYYLQARYYNPILQRFLTRDTFNDGPNRYTYVHDDPVNASDPTGHFTETEYATLTASSVVEEAESVELAYQIRSLLIQRIMSLLAGVGLGIQGTFGDNLPHPSGDIGGTPSGNPNPAPGTGGGGNNNKVSSTQDRTDCGDDVEKTPRGHKLSNHFTIDRRGVGDIQHQIDNTLIDSILEDRDVLNGYKYSGTRDYPFPGRRAYIKGNSPQGPFTIVIKNEEMDCIITAFEAPNPTALKGTARNNGWTGGVGKIIEGLQGGPPKGG